MGSYNNFRMPESRPAPELQIMICDLLAVPAQLAFEPAAKLVVRIEEARAAMWADSPGERIANGQSHLFSFNVLNIALSSA